MLIWLALQVTDCLGRPWADLEMTNNSLLTRQCANFWSEEAYDHLINSQRQLRLQEKDEDGELNRSVWRQ